MRKSLIVMAWFAGWLLMVSAAQADLSDGLVGYWTFDEGTGTVARDQSVSANHGTLTNGPLWVDGKFGKAIKFTEATGGQYVKTSKPIGLNQWIMSLWIKLATPFPNGESPYYGLYAMLSVDPVYGFSVNAKGVTLYPDQVTAFDFQSQADQWHHVVFGYDGKSAFAIVDGLVFGAVQTANPLAKNVLRCIGSKGWNTNNFNGIIDEVRLYNRVLTEREIAILYNPALANDITPPVITQTYPIAGSDVPSWSRYDRIRVTTDEAAACRFSDKPGVAYEDMTGIFTILSDNALAMDVKELESGKSVTYYVRCRDKAANYNLTDTPVALKVAEDHTPPEFWRINVPLITEDTADILWSTTEITDGQLEWGLTASYGNQSPVEASKAIPHAVLLQHLQPGTTYHFRVKSADVIGNMAISTDQTFTTKPLSTSVNFYVATNGSDITGDGSLSKPFATLEKARNLVRAYKTANGLPPGGITVWLRGGKYYR
ncbi:MAG: LamG-like jellyroll fold domain-containing protein, partial [Candidatus Omnitrophota bacterium]